MNQGLEMLKGMEDFRYMCLTPDRVNNTRCTIFEVSAAYSDDKKRLVIKFTANRFLKSMIRMIVARLMALGEGRINIEEFADSKSNNQLLKFRTMAGPQGLHLSKIVYPYLERDVQPAFLMR